MSVFRLAGIGRDVIPQRLAVFQGGVPSLDVVKEQLGKALVILAQGRKRSVELLARGGEPLVVLLKAFQPLLEVRVHVVAVYEPRVDLGNMTIELVGRFGHVARPTPSCEQLLVALHENEVGPFVDNRLHEEELAPRLAFLRLLLKLVGVLLPCEALHLRGLEELVKLDELLGELAPGFLRCGELGEVSYASCLKHHEYLLKARVHQRDILR